MKTIFQIFAVLALGMASFASFNPAQAAEHEDVVIKVNGMVCDFCAQAIWKVFEDYDAVEYVDVDLDAASVTVHLLPGQSLADDELDKAITYAGYDLVGIERVQSDVDHEAPAKQG